MKYAIRSIAKKPMFALIAIATLAIGIGANTAIFSLVNAVLLRPLPYAEPERLIGLRWNLSFLNLQDVKQNSSSFEAIAGVTLMPRDFTGGSEPLQAMAGLVTSDFFNVLGVQAALGRVITPEENNFGGERLVVLSHGFWKQIFNGDPGIIGRNVPLSGESFTIIGVLPPDFQPPRERPDIYISLPVGSPIAARARGVHFLRTYARLRPGSTITQAQSEMPAVERKLAEIDPAENRNRRITLMSLHERIVGESRRGLLVLFGAVGLVLLVACTNFANLLLARGAEREQEVVVRAALGARRGRIIRELLTESVIIAILGGAVGIALAVWGLDLLKLLGPQDLPRLDGVSLDFSVLGFTFLISLLTGVVFGLAPAWHASRADITGALKESGRSHTAGASRQRVRNLLVVAEIAIALVLLAGAGLLVRSLLELRNVAPGFDPTRTLSMRIELPETRYAEIPAQTQYRQSILDAVNSVPGLQAALVSEAPMSGRDLHHNFLIEGRPPVTPGEEPSLYSRNVMGDYFKTMGIRIVAGRDVTPDDRAGRPLVGVVNEAMAREYFQGVSPIGGRVRWARSDGPPQWFEIVGVAADVRTFGLDHPEEPAIYWPYAQQTQPWKRWMQIVVRTEGEPQAAVAIIKRQIWSVDPQVPVTRVTTMTETMVESYSTRRFQMLLLTVFSIIAVLLAAIGIYGVMSHAVTQRTHEIGVRMALGARRTDILGLVISRGALLITAGVALGLVASLALSRFIESLLFGVTAKDPGTFTIIVIILSLIALLACLLPAWRATKVDPMVALRYE